MQKYHNTMININQLTANITTRRIGLVIAMIAMSQGIAIKTGIASRRIVDERVDRDLL